MLRINIPSGCPIRYGAKLHILKVCLFAVLIVLHWGASVTGQTEPTGRQNVQALLQKADSIAISDPVSSEEYLRKAIELSGGMKETSLLVSSIERLMKLLHNQSKNERAYLSVSKLKERYFSIMSAEQRQEVGVLEVVALTEMDSFKKALVVCDKLAGAGSPPIMAAKISANRARILSSLNRLEEAIQEYLNADKVFVELEYHSARFEVLNNLGIAFLDLGEYPSALKYLEKARDLLDNQSSKEQISRVYGNIGVVFAEMQDLDNAAENYKLALTAAEQGGLVIEQARMLMNIGNIDLYRKNFDQAITSYNQSLDICLRYENSYCIAVNKMNIGACYFDLGQHQKAIEAFEHTQQLLDTTLVSREVVFLFDHIAKVYSAMGDDKKASMYLRKHQTVYSKLFEKERDQAIFELKIQYETELKEKQLQISHMRISQQKKRIRNLSFLIVLILIISGLLFALFAEHSRRLKSLYRRNVEIMKRLNIPRTSLAGFHSPEIHNHDSQFESLQTVLSDPVFLRNSNAGIPLLSERLNLSAAETAGLVKAYSDMTINQLLNFYRTALAREMISKRGKNARIKEVMYECGYTNKSTFYYAFRQNTGLSPSEFRQQVIENGGPKSTT